MLMQASLMQKDMWRPSESVADFFMKGWRVVLQRYVLNRLADLDIFGIIIQ